MVGAQGCAIWALLWMPLVPGFRTEAESRHKALPYEGGKDHMEMVLVPPDMQQMMSPRGRRHRFHTEFDEKDNPSTQEILLAVGGGTGAGTGSGMKMDRDILRRMRYQDKVVLLLMVGAYLVGLIFSASLAYRQASNSSPVKYYGDPRVEELMIDSNDVEDFLRTFSQPPKSVQLCVQGLSPIPALLAHLVDSFVEWQGGYYRHVFSFSLDLTPFLRPLEEDREGEAEFAESLPDEELQLLRDFLQNNTNDLATVQLAKSVHWDGWEELATNIKQKIRQKGFDGVIHVSYRDKETLTVYKNQTWANFLHMGTTRVLLGLSLVGYFIYAPYMWLRQRGPVLHPKYRVAINIEEYWQLIGDKISERGFDQQ